MPRDGVAPIVRSFPVSPIQRVATVGTNLALAPFRVLGTLAEPVRRDIQRDVRRSLGVRGEPRAPAMDAATSFLDPAGVARRVHGDLPGMMIGGLSALLLQTLHPLAMAGVADHSNYREDATGRLRRTAEFVGATTYGTAEDARRAIARVKAVHTRVRGIAPDGRPYSADDPELVTWVHVAEVDSFLRAVQRYGSGRFTPAECDAYVEEMAVVAEALGATWVPRSVDEIDAYYRRLRPELYAGAQALTARDFLLRGVARRPEDRAVYAVLAGAAVGLLPPWARRELRLPSPPLVDAVVVTPVARALCTGLRWAVPPPPAVRR